jgi:hypothetical protein
MVQKKVFDAGTIRLSARGVLEIPSGKESAGGKRWPLIEGKWGDMDN